jgi:hypothetical protein
LHVISQNVYIVFCCKHIYITVNEFLCAFHIAVLVRISLARNMMCLCVLLHIHVCCVVTLLLLLSILYLFQHFYANSTGALFVRRASVPQICYLCILLYIHVCCACIMIYFNCLECVGRCNNSDVVFACPFTKGLCYVY